MRALLLKFVTLFYCALLLRQGPSLWSWLASNLWFCFSFLRPRVTAMGSPYLADIIGNTVKQKEKRKKAMSYPFSRPRNSHHLSQCKTASPSWRFETSFIWQCCHMGGVEASVHMSYIRWLKATTIQTLWTWLTLAHSVLFFFRMAMSPSCRISLLMLKVASRLTLTDSWSLKCHRVGRILKIYSFQQPSLWGRNLGYRL